MKTLNEYVLVINYENYILEQLCTHCSLEFKYINGKGLDPRFNFYNSIYESLGKFNNAGKVTEHIIKELTNNFVLQIINCKNDNVFFDNIKINIIKSNQIFASYKNSNNNIIELDLYCKDINQFNDNIDDYEKLMLHELLHAYEDYNRKKNNKPSLFSLWNINYKKAFDNLNSNDKIKQYLSRCKYLLNSQERNAYFSQLEYNIKRLIIDEQYSIENFNYELFKNQLKNKDIWKIYYDLSIFIEGLNDISDTYKKSIEKTYNKIFGYNKKFSEIKKEIINQWKKFDSKFNQLVPKIICNNIQIKEHRNFGILNIHLNKYFEL